MRWNSTPGTCRRAGRDRRRIERHYPALLGELKAVVKTCPIALKLSPFFSSCPISSARRKRPARRRLLVQPLFPAGYRSRNPERGRPGPAFHPADGLLAMRWICHPAARQPLTLAASRHPHGGRRAEDATRRGRRDPRRQRHPAQRPGRDSPGCWTVLQTWLASASMSRSNNSGLINEPAQPSEPGRLCPAVLI